MTTRPSLSRFHTAIQARMCIVIVSTAHPDYPFILLSNRDEFLNRPTAGATWWDEPNSHVLGGRDLQRAERGTWLAITKQGRIAALTNFREEDDDRKAKDKSRGGIVNAYLTSPPGKRESPQRFAERLINDFGVNDVGGFSLLFGELRAPKDQSFSGLSILSNRSASAEDLTTIASSPLETHGLSNSHFGDTSWPKVVHGEQLLKQAVAADVTRGGKNQDYFIKSLFDILSIDMLPKRMEGEDWNSYVQQMRNSILIPPVGGPSVDVAPADQLASGQTTDATTNGSGVQVGQTGYGTQKQTVILVDQKGRVKFVERTLYDQHGSPMKEKDGERMYEFDIEGWDS
ncbi:hypothetical protein LTR37_006802 [Vermiconidia calcicola]|uniref:Uncharacterized protein n=1 Tax=Vermiconidia calcicola TaxID=1690605 RepID=A0ACC3NF07_9PEZI|nr:hypothetical protein LTR37_006802 [Vermiconidia calcicola]